MPYETMATSKTPALIIYLLDVSASMSQPLGEKRRIDVVMDALQAALTRMVHRSTKGLTVSPRYRIAMFAYSEETHDMLGGARGVDEVARLGIPELSPMTTTDTAGAFLAAEELLQREELRLRPCPAPLICHMTDGEYTGADPEPIVRRIMQMRVPDGPILVENIFVSDKILPQSIQDVHRWPGIQPSTQLSSEYARNLQSISSPIPESYRGMMREYNYQLAQGALMMLPGMNPELVQLGFQMSAATPVQ